MKDGKSSFNSEPSFDDQLGALFQLWSGLPGGEAGSWDENQEDARASLSERQSPEVGPSQFGQDDYQLLVEHSPQGLAIVQDFDIVYANPALSQITGYSLEEMRVFSSEMVRAALRFEDQDKAWERLVGYLADGALPPRLELCFPHKDGTVCWAETNASNLRFKNKPTILVTCIDITERKQAELELQQMYGELELRFRERAEELATANGALQAEILERQQAEKALQRAHDELEMRVQRRTEELAKLNETLQFEIVERRQIEVALRRSEELFRALSENAADIITVIAEDGTIRYESPSITRLLGYEPAELVGKNAFNYVHPDDRARVIAIFAEALAVPRATRWAEFRFRHKNGVWRILESIGKNLTGNPIIEGVVVHSRDITQRKQIENEKARLLDKVQRQHEQLRVLAARRWQLAREVIRAQEEERYRVSRELHDEAGQALTALKVSMEMMLADLSPADPAGPGLAAADRDIDAAGRFHKGLVAALALCDSTMSQIRILAHDLRPAALEDLGLNLTLEGFCRDFAERTRMRIEYAGQDIPLIPGEAEICLYRFLQESLTNVAKHANANRVQVALTCQAKVITLSVEDDGCGFDASATRRSQGQNHGIGLLGMEERLVSIGGRLEIESIPGLGARLMAQIPVITSSQRKPAPDGTVLPITIGDDSGQ
jgi:PAS domain S-box-containing protein